MFSALGLLSSFCSLNITIQGSVFQTDCISLVTIYLVLNIHGCRIFIPQCPQEDKELLKSILMCHLSLYSQTLAQDLALKLVNKSLLS